MHYYIKANSPFSNIQHLNSPFYLFPFLLISSSKNYKSTKHY
nr:MAG TPA: hypothetical protein [Caudoviricetes sp.]